MSKRNLQVDLRLRMLFSSNIQEKSTTGRGHGMNEATTVLINQVVLYYDILLI